MHRLLWVANWQTIDLSTMIFPAEFLIDYVRVYQRKGATNVGCDPPGYPTKDYIDRHEDAYQSEFPSTFLLLSSSSPVTTI